MRRQLGMACSRSPRVVRGIGGLFIGGIGGAVLGVLVGGTVTAKRLATGAPGEPISAGFGTALAIAAIGAAAGAVGAALPPECE